MKELSKNTGDSPSASPVLLPALLVIGWPFADPFLDCCVYYFLESLFRLRIL
jgi:hypothetical protein